MLAGRTALITGAASGQGRAAALLFASHGASISVVDINDEGAEETVALVEKDGGSAAAIHADVSLLDDCRRMVDETVAAFDRIDILYNNAAVQMSGRLLECTEEQWDLTIATNLDAIFTACRAAIPCMLAGDGGSIINTSSVLGLIGSEGYCAYGVAKAGLVALTRQIAVDYGPRIRANVIAPGSIDTPRFRKVLDGMGGNADGFLDGMLAHVPLRRLGLAEDIANAALFLAADASAYTSGAVIPCDGGLSALR